MGKNKGRGTAKGKGKPAAPDALPTPAAKPLVAKMRAIKRPRDEEDDDADALREAAAAARQEEELLEFEDEYPDEVEEDSEGEDDGLAGEEAGVGGGGVARQRPPKGVAEPLPEGEELEYDPSAYQLYHAVRAEWPCLSFDFVRDALGTNRSRFPHTVTAVVGTQADRADRNKLTLLRLSRLHRQKKEDDSDDDESDEESSSDDDSDADEEPLVEHTSVAHKGGVNRVRSMPQRSHIVASWADTASVHVWDLERELSGLGISGGGDVGGIGAGGKAGPGGPATKPVFTLKSHPEEGFAMDWSPVEAGLLASGDCAGNIFLARSTKGGAGFEGDPSPFVGHGGSVEDLQWSPTERTVFASASADSTVAIWDTRRRGGSMLSVPAHSCDANVISWNRGVTYLLASGADDGTFKVWDLRSFSKAGGGGKGGKAPEPVAQFSYHAGAVTSLEWHPTDDSMLAVAGADNKLTIWDLSVEADDAEDAAAAAAAGADALPRQLMFVHQGQHQLKELHYHPQVPGLLMSTAEDGFNVFKPAISS